MPWSESQRLHKDHNLLIATTSVGTTDHSTGGGTGGGRANGHIDPVVDEEVYDDRLFYSLLLKVCLISCLL